MLVLLIGLLVMGCSTNDATSGWTGPSEDALVTYQRMWPDGYEERQTVDADGSVRMLHGDRFERLALPSEDVDRIITALQDDILIGDPGDSPERTLTLADGTIIEHPQPVAGSIVELMDRLMDTHSLG